MELVALVFPDAALQEERILLLDMGARSPEPAKANLVRGWRLRAPQTYVVSEAEMFRRLEGVVRNVAELSDRHVACFGLGAIGSAVALALAREGVGSFSLCDPDTLRPGNVTRHALDLMAAG
jgi:sulfur-carrier protein adenylyltransferase/sulfurtransferase